MPLVINVTTLRRDCCLIVDSFEKNYRGIKNVSVAEKCVVVGVS
jgi:hypothetical protein